MAHNRDKTMSCVVLTLATGTIPCLCRAHRTSQQQTTPRAVERWSERRGGKRSGGERSGVEWSEVERSRDINKSERK